MTTMRERLIEAARTKLEASCHVVDAGLCSSIIDAILETLATPDEGMIAWLNHQIEHGHAPDGYLYEMDPLYAAGRLAAFQSTLAALTAMINHVKEGR